jgi:tetratricopeptide (TPR) repeat protein
VLCYVTVLAQRSTGAIASMASVPLKQRVLNAVISYAVYLEKMVWPSRLAMYYPPRESLPLWTALGAGTALILVSLLAVKFARSRPYLLVGWLWYLGMLVPVIGLVQVGLQAMADRYTYLPLIGIFVAIAWGVSDLAIFNFQVPEKLEPPHVGCYNALAVTAIAVLAAFWCLTAAQVRLWKNSETLYRHTIAVAPKNPIVLGLLGDALVEQRRFAEGAEQFEAALRITPGYAEAESNLGFALVMQGHLDEGMEHYRNALELKPQLDTTHYVLGQALLLKGRRDDAIAEFRAALAVNPESPAALNDLAWILATDPDPSARNGSEAVTLGERTCSLTEYRNPLFVGTLAAAYAEAGRFEDAIRTGEKAREIALAGGQQALADRNAELLKEYRAGKAHREAERKNEH